MAKNVPLRHFANAQCDRNQGAPSEHGGAESGVVPGHPGGRVDSLGAPMTGLETSYGAGEAYSSALLRAVVESTSDVIFVRNLRGQYVLANSAAAQANGVNVDTLLGSDDSLLFTADVVRDIQEDDRRTVAAGVTRTFERVLRPRNEPRTYHVTKGPCRDRAGNVVGVFVIARDVTERKQLEEQRARLLEREHALREQAERTRATAETAARALSTLDQITEAALASLSLDELLQTLVGRIRQAFEVDTVAVLLLDAEQREFRLRAAAGLEGAMQQGIRFPAGRGLASRIVARGRPVVIDDLSEVELASSHLHDYGVRSLMGAPLRHSGREFGAVHVGSLVPRHFTDNEATLLLLAADRMAAAIEHAELYDQALRANRARDAMLGVVAHDLRNPLNVIALRAQVMAVRMERNGASEDDRAAVDNILATAHLMDRLVQDLLDVTRIEAGELPLAVAPLAVGPLVAEAIDQVRPLASKKMIEIELRVAEGLCEVPGDRYRLLQVLGNLLGNAVKFTDASGRVTVVAERAGPDVQISIADTGPGIRPEHLPHVFDRYWRATAGDQRHTGLGLSIARGIVQSHGGKIWVTSTFGSGARFFVALPCVRA